MIVLEPAVAGMHGETMWVRPNRSLSPRGLRAWIGSLLALVWGIALWVAEQGNVFAPLFAMVESAALVAALAVTWRSGERSERITVDARLLQLEWLPGRRRTQFQTYWVRVQWRGGPGRHRLFLASHGREVEVGAFLGEEERAELSQQLKVLLARAKAPGHGADPTIQGATR